jgi:hypothetical protein
MVVILKEHALHQNTWRNHDNAQIQQIGLLLPVLFFETVLNQLPGKKLPG